MELAKSRPQKWPPRSDTVFHYPIWAFLGRILSDETSRQSIGENFRC